MPEFVAVVGSRQGADLEAVERFVRALRQRQPDTVLVSGGAKGVDKTAEDLWLKLGGVVWSYRPKQIGDNYGVELWRLGEFPPSVGVLADSDFWAAYAGAAWYRNLLIAQKADRVVAFYRRNKSRGTMDTIDAARAEQKPFYEYEAA